MVKLKSTNQPTGTRCRFLCCILVFGCATAFGQDEARRAYIERFGTPEAKAKAASAAAQAPPVYRVVEGKVYDVSRSVLWKHFDGDCLTVLSNGITPARDESQQGLHDGPSESPAISRGLGTGRRFCSPETRHPGKRFFLRNYPPSLWPTTGKRIEGLAMQTGVFQHSNETLEQWDYGVDYTPQAHMLTPEEAAAAKTEADRKKAERGRSDFEIRVGEQREG